MRTSKAKFSAFMLAALGLLLIACTNKDDQVDEFVGMWAYNTGSTLAFTCPEGPFTNPITHKDEFANGVETDLVVLAYGCPFRGNVTGNRMEWIPGQTCNATGGSGTTYTLTFNSMTYTLADEVTMSMSSAGTRASPGVNCTFTGTGSLRKIAN